MVVVKKTHNNKVPQSERLSDLTLSDRTAIHLHGIYKRNGTTTLFAALNVIRLKPRRRSER